MTIRHTISYTIVMRFVNIKNFHKDFFREVDDLPITITKYGVPAYVLTKVDTKVNTQADTAEKIPEKTERTFEELKEDLNTRIVMCEIPYCRNQATVKATYENPETFEEESKCLCNQHLATLKRTVEELQEEAI